MKVKTLILLLCLATNSLALSPEGKETYIKLVALLNDQIEQLNVDPDGNQNEILSIKQYGRQIEQALAQGNNRNIIRILDNFGNFNPSEEVQKSMNSFKETLEKENAAKTRAYITELEGILTKTAEILQTADTSESLDKTLEALNRNNFRHNDEDIDGNNPTIRSLVDEISSARQFIAKWQEYIQASNAGNLQQSLESLHSLAQLETTLIPRSQILRRIAFEQFNDEDITKVLEETTSLDGVRDAIGRMSKFSGSSSNFKYGTTQREVFTALKTIDSTYQNFLGGLPIPDDIFREFSQPDETTGIPAIVKLRSDLLRLMLPTVLELPENTLIKENEAIEPFLDRATHEAVHRDDISAAMRIRDIRQRIFQNSSYADKDGKALIKYYSALQQIEAKQWIIAVISLHETLESGSTFIPGAKVGKLLENLRSQHPAEYKQGIAEILD